MERVRTLEQYNNILKGVRRTGKTYFSNNYFFQNGISRFIDLKRLYWHITEGGIVLLFDEEVYFRACLYLDGDKPFTIPQTDKKVLLRNVYREGRKPDALAAVEKRLMEIGFFKADTTIQVCTKPEVLIERAQRAERYVKKLEEAGFRFITASEEQIPEIDQLLIDSGTIKDYHLDFRTPEEKKQNGSYLAAVDPEGNICGANMIYVQNGISEGAGCVKDSYKMLGIAPALTYYRAKWLQENNVDLMQGWIVVDNKASIEYHKSVKYSFTDKYADEWIRER